VYGSGEEPDPRFSLANERTFLAWIRTSLGLLAVAVAVDALPLNIDPTVASILAALFALTGLATALHAWRHWARTEMAMRHRQPLPSNRAGLILATGVALAGVVLLAAGLIGLGR